MSQRTFFPQRYVKMLPLTLALAASSIVLTTGCANMATTALSSTEATGAAVISGHLHGGNQPISGAAVKLYAVNVTANSTYGSAGTLYATTTSANDGSGSWSFVKAPTNTGPTTPTTNAYGCPATGDPQMYLVGTGGSTQGAGNGTNAAAAFITAIGKCSTINSGTFIDFNEVTTVGSLAALQQYFNPTTESFGYPNTTQAAQGFANGVSTVANLITVSTGTANATTTLTATPVGSTASVVVTATPEQAKINLIANITAACVNNPTLPAPACTTLFANAVPPSPTVTSQPNATFPAATDVVQATYYMLTNPTSGGSVSAMNALWGLASPNPSFQPTSSTIPSDWTIGIRYSSTSACTTVGTGTFLTGPYALAADATGNIWIAGGSAGGNLMSLTPNGTPGTCALGTSVAAAKSLAIDTGGNVWIAANAGNSPLYKYNTISGTSTTVATTNTPYAIAADGSGNVFYSDASAKTISLVAGAATSTPTAPVAIGTVGNSPFFMAVDTAGRVFTTQSATTNIIYDTYASTGTGNTNGYLTTTIGSAATVVNPYALAAGLNGSIWGGNSTSSSSSVAATSYYFTPSTTTPGTVTFSANSAQYAGGIGGPRGPAAVDGAGNVWFGNSLTPTGNWANTTTTGTGTANTYVGLSVSEFSATGAPLSPNTTTAAGTDGGGFQKDSTIIATAPRGFAIDPTGNVWFGSNSATGQGVVEIVGAAVPVITPVSAGLAAGAVTTNAVQKP